MTLEEKATVYNLSTGYYATYQNFPQFMARRSKYIYYTSQKQKWDELGPLSIEEIVYNTPAELIFNPYEMQLELKYVNFGTKAGYRIEGMFKFGTSIAHGIGKMTITKDTDRFYEGMFINKEWNGYGRLIW